MIHIFIGTKAQFIKMAPIMQKLNDKGISYNFIDSGQHAGITSDLIKQFNLRQPDVYLRDKSENIRTIPQALMWSTRNLSQPLLCPKQSFKKIGCSYSYTYRCSETGQAYKYTQKRSSNFT